MPSQRLQPLLYLVLIFFSGMWLLGFNGHLGYGYALAAVDTEFDWLLVPLKVAPLLFSLWAANTLSPSLERQLAKLVGYGLLVLYAMVLALSSMLSGDPDPTPLSLGEHKITMKIADPGAFGTAYTQVFLRCGDQPLGLTRMFRLGERIEEYRPSMHVIDDVAYLEFPNNPSEQQRQLTLLELNQQCES